MPVPGFGAWWRQASAFETIGAAHEFRRAQRTQQRLARARKHRHVLATRELQDAQRIRRGQRQRHIARDRRDAQQVEPLPFGECQQDRDGVVLARIGVDDDPSSRHAIGS